MTTNYVNIILKTIGAVTLYPAYSKLRRGNLVLSLRHCSPRTAQFSRHFASCSQSEGIKIIYSPKRESNVQLLSQLTDDGFHFSRWFFQRITAIFYNNIKIITITFVIIISFYVLILYNNLLLLCLYLYILRARLFQQEKEII